MEDTLGSYLGKPEFLIIEVAILDNLCVLFLLLFWHLHSADIMKYDKPGDSSVFYSCPLVALQAEYELAKTAKISYNYSHLYEH